MKFFSFCCDIFSHFELSPTENSSLLGMKFAYIILAYYVKARI